jgi:hypothetical protein
LYANNAKLKIESTTNKQSPKYKKVIKQLTHIFGGEVETLWTQREKPLQGSQPRNQYIIQEYMLQEVYTYKTSEIDTLA